MAAAEHDYVVYQRGEEGESDAWDDTVLIKAYDNAVSAMQAKLAEQHPEYSIKPGSSSKKKKKSKSKPKKKKSVQSASGKWSKGDLCRAVYTEDGEIYEAQILSVDEEKGTCTVQYVGYGNEEDQLLSSLLPLTSAASSQEVKTDTASETESLSRIHTAQEIHTGKQRSRKAASSHNHTPQSKHHAPKWPWDNYPPPQFGQMPPPPPSFSQFQHRGFSGYHAAGPSPSVPPIFPCVPPPPPMFTEHGSEQENEALYSMLISWYMSGYHTGYYQGLRQSSGGASAASGHGVHR